MFEVATNVASGPEEVRESRALPLLVVDVGAAAFLYERCSRCMYVHSYGVAPDVPLAEPVSDLVDGVMTSAQESQHWIELNVGPRFRVLSHRGTIISAPVDFQLAKVSYSGTYDAIVEQSNGSKVLVKYILPGDSGLDTSRYQRELAALNHALEYPLDPETPPMRIDGHALLGFSARQVMVRAHVETQYVPMRWIELERRPDRFLSFMRVVTCILALAHEPPAAPGCTSCKRPRRDTGATPAGHPAVTLGDGS